MDNWGERSGELERFLRAAPPAIGSGIRSGVRGVILFLVSGMACDALIGKFEQQLYEFPYAALTLWLITGLFIFWACDRGHL